MVLWRYLKNASLLSSIIFLSPCSGGDGGSINSGGSVVGSIGTGNSSMALSWTAPSTRADNTPLSLVDIAGYRIYYGVEKGSYLAWTEIPDGTVTQATISGIPLGTYFVAMTTIEGEGLESGYSPELKMAAK